ncbi:unnamed protein product [Lactuca virosa]|uniref:Helitron helicase-like domain-containing protein n=1 Tax=Lactuca virosa TaxID=75947 RepID=A0AAU9N6F2_9ASTR|nr:unnamed protein product [Lactuca virosa]
MDSLGNTSVHSSDIDFPLTTDVSTALPSDTIEDEQVTRRRRGGRPRVRGRPPDCSIDDITYPRCRRGRPSFVVSPYFVGDNAHRYSQHGSIHVSENIITSNSVPSMAFSSACTVNIDVTRTSDRPSPHMIISSSTTIGIDGNPVHSTIMSNLNAPSTTNNSVVHSVVRTYSLHNGRSSAVLPSNTFDAPAVRRPSRGGRPRVRGRPPTFSIDNISSTCHHRGRPSSANSNDRITTNNSVVHSSIPTVDNARSSSSNASQIIQSQRRMLSYWDCGDATRTCIHCEAILWYEERTIKTYSPSIPKFSICCSEGKIKLPLLMQPPQLLWNLLDYNGDRRSKVFRKHIKLLNHVTMLRLLVQELLSMLDENNSLVQAFHMAKDRFHESSTQSVKIRLIGNRTKDGRQYNLPTVSEVAALIPGDGSPIQSRDVLIEDRGDGTVRRISKLHPSFMALQYPLLFPNGEDGFHLNIPLSSNSTSHKRKNVTLREYYCFRLHFRLTEGKTLHKAGRLLHTFIVDAYAAVLEHDLEWYKRNQKTIRSELYHGLTDSLCRGETSASYVGHRVILPSSFNGGPKHKIQQYQDAMAICCWAGTPDLFVTMTCNPKWPEIERHIQQMVPGQPSTDRPDIVTQLPSQENDPIAFEAVRSHMMHGPCGQLNTLSPCMHNGSCSKGYPKEYCDETFIRRDGWPCYKRSNDGSKVKVGNEDIMLDNRYVVPHNVDLLVKYGCHINVEYCNQGSLIKYLFSYINKGHDRATVVLEGPDRTRSFISMLHNENEIEEYINCRYISVSEACWKLLGFEIQYRSVAVERLPFHEEVLVK